MRLVGTCIALLGLVACQGNISGSDGSHGSTPPDGVGPGGPGTGPNGGPGVGDPNAVGPRPLSRLTRREYNNTVRDLLGDTSSPANDFPDDRDRSFLFRRAGLVATQDADLLRMSAEALAAKAMENPSSVLPCTPAGDEAGCAGKFIDEFGLRAYRRPLSSAESTHLKALYDSARGSLGLDFNAAITLLLEAMLQAPAFIYHWESPYEAPTLENGVVKLGQYDVASRLSYFIWGSMPDQALFDAAKAGKLSAEADITAQAKRMLQDERARDAATAFFGEWLELDQLKDLPKDSGSYPAYDDALKADMVGATDAFVEDVLFESGGKLETLLSADFTYSNASLAKVFGGSASGTSLSKVMLDASQRLGLLTQPSFLSMTGSPNGSNPVKRGKAVYEKLLCGVLPPPPANVPPAKPASAGGTTRQRFAEHDQNECAKGCHLLMDPIGFAFEHYDGIGQYRTMDNGGAVDSTGKLTIDGSEKTFADAVELTKLLAGSDEVRACFSRQWFRFAMGRPDSELDAPSLASVAAAFAVNQFDMRDLAPAIAVSRSFRYRAPAAGEVLK
jgi:hypothetical protein